MHLKGYLHLDIKPQNILVDEHLNLKMADFGSTWLFHQDNDQVSDVKGTSYFLAPEAISDPANKIYRVGYFSGRAYDVWTIGMSLYVMVFNRLPYTPDSKGMSDITKAIARFTLEFNTKDNFLETIKEVELGNTYKSGSQSLADSILDSPKAKVYETQPPKMRKISEGL
jgi:serine/threonine protein kinase